MKKQIDVVIGLVGRAGKVLICQRRERDPLGGYWEFPGGKQEPGESRVDCLKRELREELAIQIRPMRPLDTIEYDYAEVRVRLHPFVCQWVEGEPQPLASEQLAWATPDELRGYRFPPANDPLLDWLSANPDDLR